MSQRSSQTAPRQFVFSGKRALCFTEVVDFTNFSGIGGHPLYMRYESVWRIIQRVVPIAYQHFLSQPEYQEDSDQICWHITQWGETYPEVFSELTEQGRAYYTPILEQTREVYAQAIQALSGQEKKILEDALRGSEDTSRIYCVGDKVYVVAWGMSLNPNKHHSIGQAIHEYSCQRRYTLFFDEGQRGTLPVDDRQRIYNEGIQLTSSDLPQPTPDEGWQFEGWQLDSSEDIPSDIIESLVVDRSCYLKAVYSLISAPVVIEEDDSDDYYVEEEEEEEYQSDLCRCRFSSGANGMFEENETSFELVKHRYSNLSQDEIPIVVPSPNYQFVGWDKEPVGMQVTEDIEFVAQYSKLPWYKRLWAWICGLFDRGCLKWLIGFLLLLLLIALFAFLLRSCNDREHHDVDGDNTEVVDGGYNGDDGGSEGAISDGIGSAGDSVYTRPITDGSGSLPSDDYVASPILGDGGSVPPTISNPNTPGSPTIIANRLVLFLEDEGANLDALAKDFKTAYPESKYAIIGMDRQVKSLTILFPENERDRIRQELPSKLSKHKFLVIDEELLSHESEPKSAPRLSKGWHLQAVHLQEAWKVSRGSKDVKVAVVDDGLEVAHPLFKGRIVQPYNIFTQDSRLSAGRHGTHVAGIAVGSSEYISQGVSGIAPDCKLMPIQVFQGELCTTSSLISGIMYAIHHDADVVNISVGPQFTGSGLNKLPIEEQKKIAETSFKASEKLWKRVSKLATEKQTILVFASGNDNILSLISSENRSTSSISVSAVDQRRYQTEFTNFGIGSDISAPGMDIYSSVPSKSFAQESGTSMAAPVVSGTLALMKSVKRDLTVEQVLNVLYRTGEDTFGDIPPMVRIDRALEAVRKGDFSRGPIRKMKPLPQDAQFSNSTIGEESQTSPKDKEYEAIRRQIDEYKRKIEELEQLLPHN